MIKSERGSVTVFTLSACLLMSFILVGIFMGSQNKVINQKKQLKSIENSYKENSGVYNYVDCSYLQILLEYGIVFLLICVLMYSYILYKAYQENNIYLCCCIIIILVFSITEPRLLNLMYNPFPLLAVSYLRSKERGSKNVLLKDGIVI